MMLNLILIGIIILLICFITNKEHFVNTYISNTLPYNHNFRMLLDTILGDINNRYNVNYTSGTIERVDIDESNNSNNYNNSDKYINLNIVAFIYEVNRKITLKVLFDVDMDQMGNLTINSIQRINSIPQLERGQTTGRNTNLYKTDLGKYTGYNQTDLDYTQFNEKNKSDKIVVNRTNNIYDLETQSMIDMKKQFPCRRNQHVWDTLGVQFIEGTDGECRCINSGASSTTPAPTLNPTIFVRNEDSYEWLFDVASDVASRPVGITGARGTK